MKLANDEIGQFLGGLFAVLVRNRAHEIAGDMDDDEWHRVKATLFGGAFDDTVRVFPEPLRTRMVAARDEWLATMLGLN